MFIFSQQRLIKFGLSYIKSSYKSNSHKQNNFSKPNSVFKLQEWNQLLSSCPDREKNLISSILKNENNRSIISQITAILDYSLGKKISTYSIALLTIALHGNQKPIYSNNVSKSLELFLFQYSFQPKDHPIFNEKVENKLNEKIITELTKILFTIQKQGSYADKVKRSVKNKVFMVNFLKQVSRYIQSYESVIDLFNFFSLLQEQGSSLDRFRFSHLVSEADKKLQEFYEKDPSIFEVVETNKQKSLYTRYIEILKILKVINFFEVENEKSIEFYLKIIFQQKYIQKQLNKKALLHFLLKAHRLSVTYLDKDQKNPILEVIKKEFKEDEVFRGFFNGVPQIAMRNFLSQIIKAQFYHKYLCIPHQIIQQHIVITQKQTRPELEEIVVKLLSMNSKIKLNQSFHLLYPQYLGKQFDDRDLKNMHIDNEFSIRMRIALNNLGIKYEAEKKISGRHVDFFLEDNIVIQCDGDFHIDYKTLNISVNTANRNLALIISGYKVLVFGIEQLNKNRNIKSLEELVKKKLRIMKDHNAFLVE